MKPRQYAERLRQQGYSYEAIRVFVGLVYGKPVNMETIRNWLSPSRQATQRKYMREWMRQHRAAAKKPGKPVVDRDKFNTNGPFK